ncbi:nitrogen fixation protein NifQ [Bradyrhizobium sp. Tv2a-2]|uniref:nitrogen fixation protein NifQ n=1 Tax=Bradyrhizobium sp. Tv2a-2 TaxID=113395 RepID=UPI0004242F86|nr:nitrogen fixation protein NifQ [Bradyrhizobium sp. Tv2a-2]
MLNVRLFPLLVAGSSEASGEEHRGIATYRLLTGAHPADVDITNDSNFDRHALASILAAAAMDGGFVSERAGLSSDELATLLEQHFPSVRIKADELLLRFKHNDNDEVIMVRDLLLSQRSTRGDTGRWLAQMIARRAIEPNHLWEDLGLRDRGELCRLLDRHFASLAGRNTNNMRWKRFFYRTLCADEGLVICTTPVCTQCKDFNLCFGDESGESRMAERRREALLQEPVPAAGRHAAILESR